MERIDRHLTHGPKENNPNRIIVHSMAEFVIDDGDILHATDFLEKIGLSAHALVTPRGELIRCRNDDEGAWHAKSFNKDSLGIEYLVEGTHDYQSFLDQIKLNYVTDKQWWTGLTQIKEWIDKWPIEKIDRHSDVDPARKKDPGDGFHWEALLDELQWDQYEGQYDLSKG